MLGEKLDVGNPGGDLLEDGDLISPKSGDFCAAAGTGVGENDSWLDVLDGVAVLGEETEGEEECFFFFFLGFFGVVGSSSSVDMSCARLGCMVKVLIILIPAML